MATYHLAEFSDTPRGKLKLCKRFTAESALVQLALYQRKRDCFAVQYGKQVDDNLSYGDACDKLGQMLMHALSCEGAVDNRMPGER